MFDENRKEANKAREEKHYDKELKDEFEDTMAELREEHEAKMANFDLKMKAWKFQQTKKSAAQKRQADREEQRKLRPAAEITDVVAQMEEKQKEAADLKIIAEEELIKPIKPVSLILRFYSAKKQSNSILIP